MLSACSRSQSVLKSPLGLHRDFRLNTHSVIIEGRVFAVGKVMLCKRHHLEATKRFVRLLLDKNVKDMQVSQENRENPLPDVPCLARQSIYLWPPMGSVNSEPTDEGHCLFHAQIPSLISLTRCFST